MRAKIKTRRKHMSLFVRGGLKYTSGLPVLKNTGIPKHEFDGSLVISVFKNFKLMIIGKNIHTQKEREI